MASSVSGQDESNPTLWLATRAGKIELSCPLGTTRPVPQEKFPRKPCNKSIIDQACSIKMAGYWPRSFFACLWINTQKKNEANIQSSWPHTWSITHTYYSARTAALYFLPVFTPGVVVRSIYGLLTKCEVKMAAYWPSSVIACLWTERESRSINSQKKERGQYPATLTEQAWSIKDLLYDFRGNFSCRTRRVVPSGQDSSILPARVANHSAGFDSSCPLTELAI